MNEYQKLIDIVNNNLITNLHNEITFEAYENISENLYCFPVDKLLNLEEDEVFLHEVYFKMLNRDIDSINFEHLLSTLKDQKATRMEIIKNVYNSEERKMKKTNIIFFEKE